MGKDLISLGNLRATLMKMFYSLKTKVHLEG